MYQKIFSLHLLFAVFGLLGANLSPEDELNFLKYHNAYRETIAGAVDHWGNELDIPCDMKAMTWSKCLADLAQINTDAGNTNHEHDEDKFAECASLFGLQTKHFDLGQNIWWTNNLQKPCEMRYLNALASWYSEVQYYDVNTCRVASPFRGSTNGLEVITHLQQVIWANTSYVGCATGGTSQCVVVCNYWPPVKILQNSKPRPYKTGLTSCCPSGYTAYTGSKLCVEDSFDPTEYALELSEEYCDEGWYFIGAPYFQCIKWEWGKKRAVEANCEEAGGRFLSKADFDPVTNKQFLQEMMFYMGTIGKYQRFKVAWIWVKDECILNEETLEFDVKIFSWWDCSFRRTCGAVKLSDIFANRQSVELRNCWDEGEKDGQGNWESVAVGVCLKDSHN